MQKLYFLTKPQNPSAEKMEESLRAHAFYPSVSVKRLVPHAVWPKRGTPGAVGYDLAAAVDAVVPPNGGTAMVGTGLALVIPTFKGGDLQVYARIAPRSGLAVKNGIDVLAGVVDPDYRGEVRVVLINHGSEPFQVRPGDRVAQMVFETVVTPVLEEVERVTETDRGNGGFGSTGV